MRGQFVTVEGQDGAGKSTGLEVVAAALSAQDIEFVQSREPGGTPFGERVREVLLHSDDRDFGDLAELMLVFAARSQHIQDVIEPALAAGKWVICDRFTDATFAYQGGGRGVPHALIQQFQHIVQNQLRPDLTLLLDVPIAVGEQRVQQRGDKDRFERQQAEFKRRVRATYLQLAEAEPTRIKVIDASQSLSEVSTAIQSQLEHFLQDVV